MEHNEMSSFDMERGSEGSAHNPPVYVVAHANTKKPSV